MRMSRFTPLWAGPWWKRFRFGQFEVTVMGLDLQRDGSINSRMNFIA